MSYCGFTFSSTATTSINDQVSVIVADDDAFVVNLNSSFDFCGDAFAQQLYLQSPLINTFQKTIAEFTVNLESRSDNFLGRLPVKERPLLWWVDFKHGPSVFHLRPSVAKKNQPRRTFQSSTSDVGISLRKREGR